MLSTFQLRPTSSALLGCFSFFGMLALGFTMGRSTGGVVGVGILTVAAIIVAIVFATRQDDASIDRSSVSFARGFLIGALVLAALFGGCMMILSNLKF
jgi:NADH:ubiquinone oxidoreductase subunit 6 (subunit J)